MVGKRYDPRTVARIVSEIQAMLEASQDALDNEESRDYPNNERVDMLQTRVDALQEAYNALEGIEG